MQKYNLGAVSFSAIIVFCLVSPVSAYYFEFISFETDQLVYEVGETINMVASLIADYSESGWCYVSFAVVSDIGTVHTDGYSIPASTNPQFPVSSYLITPSDTNPGINGTQAYVMFSAEIYDTFSEGGSDSIVVNITRGRLETIPLVSLVKTYGQNSSFSFRVQSIHTDNVVYSNENLSIVIRNNQADIVCEINTTTDINGEFEFIWDTSLGPPSTYNMSISSIGTEDFIPFTESFSVIIEPAQSKLSVISAPEVVYCQSPDGVLYEYAEITIEHLDYQNIPLTNSTVAWTFESTSGIMNHIGSGYYNAFVPIHSNPGTFFVNFSATNSVCQSSYNYTTIEVIRRTLNLNYNTPILGVANTSFTISIMVIDEIESIGVPFLQSNFTITVSQTIIANFLTSSDASGLLEYTIKLPSDAWGPSHIEINILETINYNSISEIYNLSVNFTPTISAIIVNNAILGYNSCFNINITDFYSQGLDNISVEFRTPDNEIIATNTSDSQGICTLQWVPSTSFLAGVHNFKLSVRGNPLDFINDTSITLPVVLFYPIHLIDFTTTSATTRGSRLELNLSIISEFTDNHSISFSLHDNLGDIYENITLAVNRHSLVPIDIDHDFGLGVHQLYLIVKNQYYSFIGITEIEISILGIITVNATFNSAFYSEGIVLSLQLTDDNMSDIDYISISVFFDDETTSSSSSNNMSLSTLVSIPLPTDINPGPHTATILFSHSFFETSNITIAFTVLVRTSITISISTVSSNTSESYQQSIQDLPIASSISSGSIINPPPILLSGTISTPLLIERATSLDNCPKFNSGISNLSTVSENNLTSSSGNGQIVRSRNDLTEDLPDSTKSSTDLDVEPNDIMPHSALLGPVITTSLRKSEFLRIFSTILRMS